MQVLAEGNAARRFGSIGSPQWLQIVDPGR